MDYLNELKNLRNSIEEEVNTDMATTHKKIFDYFSNIEDAPSVVELHSFASSIGIDKNTLEGHIYMVLHSFLGEGRSKDFDGKYDIEELNMGIEVEYEHTTSSLISERIARDHLSECENYYSRLKKMENDCED